MRHGPFGKYVAIERMVPAAAVIVPAVQGKNTATSKWYPADVFL